MSQIVVCRTCGKKIYNLNARKLFDANDKEILNNIQILTGIHFEEDKYMPQHICGSCNLDLNHSIAFRERCIKTNKLMLDGKRRKIQAALSSAKNKAKLATKTHSTQLEIVKVTSQHPLSEHRSSRKVDLVLKHETETATICKTETQPKLLISSISYESDDCGQSETTPEEVEEIVVNVAPPKEEGELRDDSGETTARKVRRPAVYKNLVCDQCGKCFADSSNLKIHILRHSGVRDFKCTECGEKFFTRHLLHLHIRVRHLGEKPYACKYCQQRFFTSTSRCRHERTHVEFLQPQAKAPAIMCIICNKTFTKKTSLDHHAVVHSGVQPFCCDICNVHFNRKSSLQMHYRSKAHLKKTTLKAEIEVDTN